MFLSSEVKATEQMNEWKLDKGREEEELITIKGPP